MRLNLDFLKEQCLCVSGLSISVSDNKFYDVYCCRVYNSIDKRMDYNWVKDHIDEYLEITIDKPFIVNQRYPEGYCLCSQNDKICNKKIIPNQMIKSLSIGTLTSCNYSCPNCAQKLNKKSNLTVKEEIELTCNIIEKLSKYKYISELILSNNGEISLYNTDRICNAIIQNGNIKSVDILTNGSNYIEINKMSEKLKKHRIECQLNISFYSFNNDLYKKLTGQTNVSNILDNLEKFTCKRIFVNFIIFKENINEIDKVLQYCKEHGFMLYLAPNMWDNDMHKKLIELKENEDLRKYACFEGDNIV